MPTARQPGGYAAVLGARRLSPSELQARGFSARSERYILPSGDTLSKRQVQQRAMSQLSGETVTLESRRLRLLYEQGPGRRGSAGFWKAARAWRDRYTPSKSVSDVAKNPRFLRAWRKWSDRSAAPFEVRVKEAAKWGWFVRRNAHWRYVG